MLSLTQTWQEDPGSEGDIRGVKEEAELQPSDWGALRGPLWPASGLQTLGPDARRTFRVPAPGPLLLAPGRRITQHLSEEPKGQNFRA